MTNIVSVGRDVHYVSYGTPGGKYTFECRAAKITAIDDGDESLVSLCVFNPTGLLFNRGVSEDPSDEPEGGTWHWPERVG